MKKKNRRQKNKFRALRPELNLKTRFEEIADMASYSNTLPDDAKKWLNSFSEEYVCANFNHDGPILHSSDKQKKSCFDRNNARNRDIYTREKAQGTMNYMEEVLPNKYLDEEPEEREELLESIVDKIDF